MHGYSGVYGPGKIYGYGVAIRRGDAYRGERLCWHQTDAARNTLLQAVSELTGSADSIEGGVKSKSLAMGNLRNGILAAGVAIVAAGFISPVQAQPYGGGYGPGYGMMGGGYGPGYGMMGPGYGYGMMGGYGHGWMMGPGHGYGMMRGYGGGYGPGMMYGYGNQGGNLNLTVDQVKQYLGQMIRNPNLKVGDVKEKDDDTIVADIVTKQGDALVQRLNFNRHNGFVQPEQ